MKGLFVSLQLGFVVLRAVLVRIWVRIRSGPAIASWSWSVELKMVALRSFLDAARLSPDPAARARIEEAINPPLPRHLRGVLRVNHTLLAGMETEKHELIGGGLEAHTPATLLYLHGGGYMAGSAATHRRMIANVAWATGTEVYAPNYRLAPAHRFPAALDDAMSAYEELLSKGVDPGRLFVAGDSAGGGLAAALLLRLRDEDKPLPAGTILFSPYADLEHTAASITENRSTDYLPLLLVGAGANTVYLGDHDPTDPYVSPMYGAFSGVTPLLVFAGGREMIRDDSVRLVEAAQRDGCDATLQVAPDMYHVWPALLPNHPETMRAMQLAGQFVAGLV